MKPESKMSEIGSVEELLAAQKKEKKELMAKTQKMKHSVPKGDKKKKKEVTAQISQMLADLDSKHEKEMQEFERGLSSTEKSGSSEENAKIIEAATSKVIGAKNVSDKEKEVAKENVSKAGGDFIKEGSDVIKEGSGVIKEGNVKEEGSGDATKKEGNITKEEGSGDATKIENNLTKEEGSGDATKIEDNLTKEEGSGDATKIEDNLTKEEGSGDATKKGISEETKVIKVENVAKRKVVDSIANSPTDSPEKQDKVETQIHVPTQRISKAQKRRNKKAMLEKERNKVIAEQEIENLRGLRHIESVEIIRKLSQRNLTIYEIPSDGNCLYKAIEHQLSVLKSKETTVQALREATSQYMLTHIQDYLPFLSSPETGDILNENQYVQYCEDIAKTPSWGGHIEIQVLSHVLGYPIEVIQAQGPSIITGEERSSQKLILSYHRHAYGLGEHYNSVIPESDKK